MVINKPYLLWFPENLRSKGKSEYFILYETGIHDPFLAPPSPDIEPEPL
jgi:hypothetical protein